MTDIIARDLLIVGSGPAGIACALQAGRDGWSLLVVGDEPVGGLVRAAHRLDNLPGYPSGIGGEQFADLLRQQAQRQNIEFFLDKIVACRREKDGTFRALTCNGSTIVARAVVLAVGTRPCEFSLTASDGCFHRDIRTLPADLSGRRVAVIGGGEAALDSALSVIARQGAAEVFHRGAVLRCPPALVAEAIGAGVVIRLNHVIERMRILDGRPTMQWQSENGERFSAADHLLVCIGRTPNVELLKQLNVNLDAQTVTSLPGVFLAGDVINGRDRYVATALGDGQRAALAAGEWLRETE